jgi:spore coat polysaccharide biosynthesis predicted glycosyltransferase SpsG
MYEAIYLKTPTFLITHNKHQETFAHNAEQKKLVQFFGTEKNINFKKLLLSIQYFK